MRMRTTIAANPCLCETAVRTPISFPTRRSSDLDHTGRQPPARRLGPVTFQRVVDRLGRARVHPQRARRSEEHTSELQSPYDLVCRLLLEKQRTMALDSNPPTSNRPGSV